MVHVNFVLNIVYCLNFRPPSGMTLQDDSWLKPGSKAV